MKSIVEEASSIAKAIENGWVRAGKPQEFTVRIFEEPEKGFLGMTKKPAKVGLFYKDMPAPVATKQRDFRHTEKQSNRPAQQPQIRQPQQQYVAQEKTQVHTSPVQPQKPVPQAVVQQEPKKPKWTPEMVESSKEWISKMMDVIEKSNIPFTIEPKNYYLSIKFSSNVLPDKRKEQILFKHWSYLLLQAMRHKFKRGLRGFKIVITSPA
jgi:hypothetical protein